MKKVMIILIILLFITLICFLLNNKAQNTKKEIKIMEETNSLVLYFSVTNNTEKIAKYIAEETNSDLAEILPLVEYTSDDINYNNNESRANKEQNNENARPEIKNNIDIKKYDIIYLGYPIWWNDVPKIILTLLEKYNFENKTIIPFCTSGSSGIENSINNLKKYNLNIKDGKRFSTNASKEDIKTWLNLDKNIVISVNGYDLKIQLENNSSSQALLEKLKFGNITVKAKEYSNFEKVGDLGFSLPTNDTQLTTKAGDIILYQGNKIAIYYNENTWNFTKLGKVINKNENELKQILGSDDVTLILKEN